MTLMAIMNSTKLRLLLGNNDINVRTVLEEEGMSLIPLYPVTRRGESVELMIASAGSARMAIAKVLHCSTDTATAEGR